MPSPVEWGADGTPRSTRFDDIYRPATGGLDQARKVFLQGCGLPGAWSGRKQWRILETGFGLGLNFLATWRAWRDDPQRPRLLHFASIEAWPVDAGDILRSAQAWPDLRELADDLARQWYGLLPGFHRLSFDEGHVLLTVSIGDVRDVLKQQAFEADSVFLDGFDPACNPAMWEPAVLKGVARLCRRGTGFATWTAAGSVSRALDECGFRAEKTGGLPPKRHSLRGTWDPAWEPRRSGDLASEAARPGTCAVIGAGLAGAAAAASLARRGWQVVVLEAAGSPAAGASGLPAGLLAPHQSPDDNLLSRLSRCGVRMTLRQAESVLPPDAWQLTGVLEFRGDDLREPPHADAQGRPWTRRDVAGWWHEKAAWVRPAELVRALLQHERIEKRYHCRVQALEREDGMWQALGPDRSCIARVELVVVACAHETARLLPQDLALHPVRGQVSWSHDRPDGLPPYPMNGNGHLLPGVPIEGRTAWLCGSTYGRGDTDRDERPQDHLANLERLRVLSPPAAGAMEPLFTQDRVQAWTGVRCMSSDRRPLTGPVAPGLWVSTAMGSRGLTFALLCGELMAARLHAEPLPMEKRLADALGIERALSPVA